MGGMREYPIFETLLYPTDSHFLYPPKTQFLKPVVTLFVLQVEAPWVAPYVIPLVLTILDFDLHVSFKTAFNRECFPSFFCLIDLFSFFESLFKSFRRTICLRP
jgi:hypothetical protein